MVKNKKPWMDEKGQFTYVLLFIIIFAVLIFAFAIVIPIMQSLTIAFWSVNSNTLTPILQTQITQLNDVNAQAALQDAMDAQTDMQVTTQELFFTLVTYSGIIAIIVIFFAWLLIGRRNVEAGGLA